MMIRRNKNFAYPALVITTLILLLVYSCTKTNDPKPENPYDSVNYDSAHNNTTEPDPNSITGLHKNIFSVKCANPGCHDGTFEPDYRTIQSTYSTLVYQPVNKVTLDSIKFYSLRVVPHDVSNSWIIERLTTQTTEYMPSNGERLSQEEIDHVKNWINAGCPDVDGHLPVKPNLQPNIIAYVALDAANNRLDTVRMGGIAINPFLVDPATTMNVLFVATDTADGADATDPSLFPVKEIHFSLNKDNFSGASVIAATFYIAAFNAWVVPVPVSWPSGTTVYFRVNVNDGDHVQNSEFPRTSSIDYYKTIYAFHVR